ncbi:MAG: helix-turn-helix domain-containing protein [Candidatus Peregrinibacteria bacterium]|nr:helix-turn-helix domain-containing protein [Candidatus Peregrinibacteria bacterium]
MIIEVLKKIGFNEKESLVYIQLVRMGSLSASMLATKTEINRTTIYDIIEILGKRGLISSIQKNGVTYFKALDPRELINYIEREKVEHVKELEKQQKIIKDILPELISLENPESTKPKVTFFEGEKGMRQAYEDTLTSSEEILAYANVEEMHKCLPIFFPEYYERRAVQKNIHIKCIAPDNKMSKDRQKKDKVENREMILIPKEQYEFSPEINIYDDKVLIASWKEKMAIIINSKEIADFHKKMYQLSWNLLKKTQSKKNK